MTFSVALRLGRVSNLPTVTSNVLAGIALAGGHAPPWQIAIVCIAMSLLYVAGMYLNDAFDRDIDARERPDRPIPAGQVAALTVFGAGFAMLGSGVLVIAALCAVTGSPWRAFVSALVLAALIVIYNLHHKRNQFAPFVMGLCRVCVYTTAALVVGGDLGGPVAVGCACLLAYLIGLSYIARSENAESLAQRWPLVFLGIPMIIETPGSLLGWILYVFLMIWLMRSALLAAGGKIRDAVTSLIAGISILDALVIENHGSSRMALVAAAAFALTRAFQRFVPGT